MWIIGHAHQITWTTDDFYYADGNDRIQPDSVKLEISHNGGGSWATIVASTPNTGSYSWVVTGPATATAIIRYSGVNNTEITANTAQFSIVAEATTTVVVTPQIAIVAPTKTRQFTAIAYDQNGEAMISQPVFSWTVSGGGSIGALTGLFTAGATVGGPHTVTATGDAVDGTASVTVKKITGGRTRPWIGIAIGI